MTNLLSALLVALLAISCSRGSPAQVSPNWQNLDLQKDGVFGISTEKAYDQFLKNKKATTVVVAVIDSGIDTLQDDLRPVLWTDPVDGSHGRNYIGPEIGKEDFIPMLATDKDNHEFKEVMDDYHSHTNRLISLIGQLQLSQTIMKQMIGNIGKKHLWSEDFKTYQPRTRDERVILHLILNRLAWYPNFDSLKFHEVDDLLALGQYHLEHGLSLDMKPRDTAGSAYPGGVNADVSNDALGFIEDASQAKHGTMMAGIIAAVRNNGIGIDGITDHARIMTLKLSGNIREMRNDDLASAIRYAVDHGARVISMSFGKAFSWHRAAVDDAVRYAMSRNVLMVHAAGNGGANVDLNMFYPSPIYVDGGVAPAWITVGASGWQDNATLVAPFSNYGRHWVDVFAPGVGITSTTPHSGTATWEGTSVATPVVAGLAALIWSYYPGLTAVQVKEIIMRSVVKSEFLKEKCVSGGVVNAYNALKLAEEVK